MKSFFPHKNRHANAHTNWQSVIISMSWITCRYHSIAHLRECFEKGLDSPDMCASAYVCVLRNASQIAKIDSSNWFYSHTLTPAYRGILIIYNEIHTAYKQHECVYVCALCMLTCRPIQYSSEKTSQKVNQRRKRTRGKNEEACSNEDDNYNIYNDGGSQIHPYKSQLRGNKHTHAQKETFFYVLCVLLLLIYNSI